MTTVKTIFANKKHEFPPFITKHRIFKTVKMVKKIFPEIGVSNCEKEVIIDNVQEIKETAKSMLNNISYKLNYYIPSNKKDNKLISSLTDTLKKSIKVKDGKVSLNLSKPILNKDGKVVFKKGEGVFKV